jgi:2-polyprenyl-6-methoxyphenol hydroxylase-like FAD-dependent oxidoreductase
VRVLVSGASIAGPTLAYWLSRYGFEVTVVERSSALRKAGGHAVTRALTKVTPRKVRLHDTVSVKDYENESASG